MALLWHSASSGRVHWTPFSEGQHGTWLVLSGWVADARGATILGVFCPADASRPDLCEVTEIFEAPREGDLGNRSVISVNCLL